MAAAQTVGSDKGVGSDGIMQLSVIAANCFHLRNVAALKAVLHVAILHSEALIQPVSSYNPFARVSFVVFNYCGNYLKNQYDMDRYKLLLVLPLRFCSSGAWLMLRNLTSFCASTWKLAKLVLCPSSPCRHGEPLRYGHGYLPVWYNMLKSHTMIIVSHQIITTHTIPPLREVLWALLLFGYRLFQPWRTSMDWTKTSRARRSAGERSLSPVVLKRKYFPRTGRIKVLYRSLLSLKHFAPIGWPIH